MKAIRNNILLIAASLMLLITGLLVLRLIHYPDAPQQSVSAAPQVQPIRADPPTRQELLSLVNQERARNGAEPLTEDPRLDQSAQMKADDEVKYNYFGHVSPHDGEHGYQYINLVGISCKTDAENLVQNGVFNTSENAVNAWIKSTPHHTAMINPNYTVTGFGINKNQIVEHFCQV